MPVEFLVRLKCEECGCSMIMGVPCSVKQLKMDEDEALIDEKFVMFEALLKEWEPPGDKILCPTCKKKEQSKRRAETMESLKHTEGP